MLRTAYAIASLAGLLTMSSLLLLVLWTNLYLVRHALLEPEPETVDMGALALCYTTCQDIWPEEAVNAMPAGWGVVDIQPCTCGIALEVE
jgi:hypothetical protein